VRDIYCAADRQEISLVALLDMSAAFDTVDHALLLKKLENKGVIDDALRWFKTYLSERYFSTHICGVKSIPLPLKMGVPQGSVLGPLLFTIYVKDLGDLIRGMGMRYNIYADDVQLLTHVPPLKLLDGTKRIEDCILKIQDWTSSNYLQLNEKKTEFITIGTTGQLKKVKEESIVINGTEMSLKTVVRNLGVLMDCNLKFGPHVDAIARKSYANLRCIHRLRSSLNSQQTATLVHALVLSQIDTFPAVLFGIDGIQIKKLQKVLKAAFRLTYRIKMKEKVSLQMNKKGWLSIAERIELRWLMIIFKAIKHNCPLYLSSLLNLACCQHNLRSQARGDLSVSSFSTTIGQRSFKAAAPSLWRNIPCSIRESGSISVFKTSILKLFAERRT
jgi:hypothetical protein